MGGLHSCNSIWVPTNIKKSDTILPNLIALAPNSKKNELSKFKQLSTRYKKKTRLKI